MSSFVDELRGELSCEVLADSVSQALYSVDASIYEVTPVAVVIPRTKEDIVTVTRIAKVHHVPIIARGAATGITGGCLGKGVIIDTSVHLTRILQIDLEKKSVICEPGVVQDRLNETLSRFGYRLGPDTSTGNRATIGGMVGNNAAGAHALKYGRMVDHVVDCELLLASGDLVHFGPLNKDQWQAKCALQSYEGHIYRELDRIRHEYAEDIAKDFPKNVRRASGYNLDELHTNNIAKLIAGSEGSLGIITEVTLAIVPKPEKTTLVVMGIGDMVEGLSHVPHYLTHKPFAVEMIDRAIITAAKTNPVAADKCHFIEGDVDAIFAVEFEGSDKTDHFLESIEKAPYILWKKVFLTEKEQSDFWQIRKAGLSLLLSKRSYNRALAFIEDVSIPAAKVSQFIEEFRALLHRHNKEAGIYGHIGEGCLHIRPYMDLRDKAELSLMRHMMEEVGQLVKAYGGVFSAEHGDGLIRSWTNPWMFTKRLYKAFQEVKRAFDADNIMNPGKVVNGFDPLSDLRLSPETKSKFFTTTQFDFSKEGGFELAVDLCNGNGQCRKKEGLMCPSFQATGKEKDSTRARANALRGLIHGKISETDFFSEHFYDVMDLCIQCKGCKTECPSQVDMAKMKAEYLYHYHSKKGFSFPLRSYLFANLGRLYKMASPLASIANFFLSRKLTKKLLSWCGISEKRTLPQIAKKPFSKSYQGTEQGKSVVLFADTFTEFLTPEIGHNAARILESLGYNVIVPPWQCCGRTHISKGFLPQAKEMAEKLVDRLYPYAEKGIAIIGLEPSCLLTLKDEYLDFRISAKCEKVASMSVLIDAFLEKELSNLVTKVKKIDKPIVIHGHCHQKALAKTAPTLNILKALTENSVTEIPSGCCGMAGSFGYESEHLAISNAIGELVLFPAIRQNSDAIIVANGSSCRTQIRDNTNRNPVHIVELIASCLNR